MTVALGIDTGGTYTDAALVEYEQGRVLAAAKALTTRHDLSLGIGRAIDAAFGRPGAPLPGEVGLVALSTTLATNAIVEGQGSPVCLILLGYDPKLIRQYGLEDELVADRVVYVDGGHDIFGEEASPLDESGLRRAVRSAVDEGQAQAFAVSGYFSVRNPAHEARARQLIEDWTGLPVTCGHELTTRLNSVRRATTVALNARLVPLLQELVGTLRQALNQQGLSAPLMVVKGDGSLVRAEWASRRPVETILSGPAASVVGAWHLAGQAGATPAGSAVWVMDVGGTTTDIASVQDGRPRLNPEGARVGRWRTMVEAVDVHTVGLGGDSHVRFEDGRQMAIGPQRVVPLCLLAGEHPQVVPELRRQAQLVTRDELAAQFVLAHRAPSRPLDEADQVLWKRLSGGPRSLLRLVRDSRYSNVTLRRTQRLVDRRLLLRSGFTPTDALHALGRLDLWQAEAARLAARILAARAGCSADDLSRAVVAGVSERAARALISKALGDEGLLPCWEQEPVASLLVERALNEAGDTSLDCTLQLREPLVAIGAPVEAYIPRVAAQLHTDLVIPPHAEVANAVGAVVGGVVQSHRVLITPLEVGGPLRLYLPDGVHDFQNLEESVAFAEIQMRRWLEAQAREAGAGQVEVRMARRDEIVRTRSGWDDEVYLGTELVFTAVGRPSPAMKATPKPK